MNIDTYYLDLEMVSKLQTTEERDRIHTYYMDMMNCFSENRKSIGTSIFYTLYQAGFLKEIRDEKLDKILS